MLGVCADRVCADTGLHIKVRIFSDLFRQKSKAQMSYTMPFMAAKADLGRSLAGKGLFERH